MKKRHTYDDYKDIKKTSAKIAGTFKKNSSSSSAPVKIKEGSARKKWDGRRQSSNIEDVRSPDAAKNFWKKQETKIKLDLDHRRQIYRKGDTDLLTKLKNSEASIERGNSTASGSGAKAMRAPAKKVQYNKFSKGKK